MMKKYVKPSFIKRYYKAFDVPDRYKTKVMCNKVYHTKMLKCCRDRYKCDKAVDARLPTSKSVAGSPFTSTTLKTFDNVAFSNDHIDLDYINSDINISLDDGLETMIHAKLVSWHNKLTQNI